MIAQKNQLWVLESSFKIHRKGSQGQASISAHIMSQTEMCMTESIKKIMKRYSSKNKSQWMTTKIRSVLKQSNVMKNTVSKTPPVYLKVAMNLREWNKC